MCQESEASTRYFRLNRVTEEVEPVCRPCWLATRHAKAGEWTYFRGVGRFFLLYSVLPLMVLAILLTLALVWML